MVRYDFFLLDMIFFHSISIFLHGHNNGNIGQICDKYIYIYICIYILYI